MVDTNNTQPKTHRLGLVWAFAMLTGLILLSVGSSGYLGYRLNQTLAQATGENLRWSLRLSRYSALALQSGLISDAGNQVFISRTGQLARFTQAMERFDELLVLANQDLGTIKGSEHEAIRQKLIQRLAQVSTLQQEMNDETGRIFAAVRFAQTDRVAELAVRMNLKFNALRDVLDQTRAEILLEGDRNLRWQEQSSQELHEYQRIVWITFLVLSICTLLYGIGVVRAMRQGEEERLHNLEELELRSQNMRLVLDNVDQALLTVTLDGFVSAERSSTFDHWFGACPRERKLWEHLERADRRVAMMLEIGWQALQEGNLPNELLLEQLPRQMTLGHRVLSLGYTPIYRGIYIQSILLIITDISSRIEHERAEAEQRDLMHVVERLVANREAFNDFFQESERILQQLGEPERDHTEQMRLLHTLKGNCGLFGMQGYSALCHSVEEHVQEFGQGPSPRDIQELRDRFSRYSQRILPLLGQRTRRVIEISDSEFERVLRELRQGTAPGRVADLISQWTLSPLRSKLEHCAAQIRDLARRLGRGPVQVLIESNDLRVPNERFTAFLSSLAHVLRNAVDHGIELPAERRALGKAEVALVSLRSYLSGSRLIIEVADDGRGLHWDRLAERAKERGMQAARREDLVEVIFLDGVSTKGETTEYSGRGVGMGAVRQEVQHLGGHIEVSSETGKGTTFRFVFAASLMVPHVSLGTNAAGELAGILGPPPPATGWVWLRPLVIQCCEELLGAWEVEARYLGETESTQANQDWLASRIEMKGELVIGALSVSMPLSMLRLIHPQARHGTAVPLGHLEDLLGELANQLLGRLKTQLLLRGVVFMLGLPQHRNAAELAESQGLHRLVFHVGEELLHVHCEWEELPLTVGDPVPPPGPADESVAPMTEGEMLLF